MNLVLLFGVWLLLLFVLVDLLELGLCLELELEAELALELELGLELELNDLFGADLFGGFFGQTVV